MNLADLKRRCRAAVKARLGAIDPSGGTGELSDREHETIAALARTLTGDPALSPTECRRFVDGRTREVRGALDAFRRSIALLDHTSARMMGASFSELAPPDRERVIRALVRPRPHPDGAPAWQRWIRVASKNLALLADSGAHRPLRHYVVREILSWYYTTERGWAVVGWSEFPGKASLE